ncbi:MAG: hypothetical protein M3246_07835 [Actinomycetota bacterium]|nr:hypothetical protein [Actinomycetota bacterium]
MYKAGYDDWDPTREQAWNEPEAVQLLQHAGALVAEFEAMGARVPQRELYHARLIVAHDAREMDAYRIALNGYVEAARQACRKAKREGRSSNAP